MVKIAENSSYSLEYSKEKNRVYLKINGYWKNTESAPDYLKDWNKALSLTSRKFTLLTDASEMVIHPTEIKVLHQKAQEMVLKAGVLKVAEVLKNTFAEIVLNAVANSTKFPKKNFADRITAEKWLDSHEG